MRIFRGLGLFFGGLIAQWLWSSYFPLFGLAPQVLLILTMAVSSRAGPIVGQCYGFAWGLLLDVLSAHVFGANALTFTLTGYFIGMLRRQMDVSDPVSQSMLMLVLTPIYFLLIGLIGLTFEHQFLWMGWKTFLLAPLYNSLLAPLAFSAASRSVEA